MLSALARAFRSTAGAQISTVAPLKTNRLESNAISPNAQQITPSHNNKRNCQYQGLPYSWNGNMRLEELRFSRFFPIVALAGDVKAAPECYEGGNTRANN
jgi:hypothetical protein